MKKLLIFSLLLLSLIPCTIFTAHRATMIHRNGISTAMQPFNKNSQITISMNSQNNSSGSIYRLRPNGRGEERWLTPREISRLYLSKRLEKFHKDEMNGRWREERAVAERIAHSRWAADDEQKTEADKR